MFDKDLKKIEGRWYLQFSGSPFWQKDEIRKISFNYNLRHLGEELVLEDRVEYMRNGKMRFRLGYDYPVDDIENTFRWKGVGINRFFRNRFEITILKDDYMVLFYEKTITSPTCIDIVARDRIITPEKEDEIFMEISQNPTVKEYISEVEKINQD